MAEQRRELAYERHELPSRFWEPEPDEEDLKRLESEYMERIRNGLEPIDDEERPFICRESFLLQRVRPSSGFFCILLCTKR